jgi:hypothetical protein
MRWTWALSALPEPVTACLIWGGEYSPSGTPDWAEARMATPRACATLMAVETLEAKNSSSTATSSGWKRSISSREGAIYHL